jgi:hypothetical protein
MNSLMYKRSDDETMRTCYEATQNKQKQQENEFECINSSPGYDRNVSFYLSKNYHHLNLLIILIIAKSKDTESSWKFGRRRYFSEQLRF